MLKVISKRDLADLHFVARNNVRARMNLNIHESYSDVSQRFLNAIGPNSYIQPHKHSQKTHLETLVAINGRMLVILFEDRGNIFEVKVLSNKNAINSNPVVSIPSDIWHTVVATEECSTLFECKQGPFNPAAAKIIPSWAPKPETDEATNYLLNLKISAEHFLEEAGNE
jgi:cupin fold WbuC family metalloprotein